MLQILNLNDIGADQIIKFYKGFNLTYIEKSSLDKSQFLCYTIHAKVEIKAAKNSFHSCYKGVY